MAENVPTNTFVEVIKFAIEREEQENLFYLNLADRADSNDLVKLLEEHAEEELSHKTFQDFTHPDDLAIGADYLKKMIAGDITSGSFEKRYIKKDEKTIWVSLSTSLVRDDKNNPLYFVTQTLDVTDRKKAEEEIRVLNEELEQRVIERTKQLQAANKELEAFSYSVSHDLRAPLRAIDGFSQALIEDYNDQLDEDAQTYLSRLRTASQRMGELTDALLILSRVTRSEVSYNAVDLSEIVKMIISDLKRAEPRKNVEIIIEPKIIVEGDQQLLRVALENLLSNSWKFTRKKENTKLEFGKVDQNGKPAYFIKDNGAGFDMTYADKLFGAFQRLHSVDEFEGTGVGLATVQRIFHRHNGDIWAESEVGKGATFYFTISGVH